VHFGIQAQINSAARVAVANRTGWGGEGPPDPEALVERGRLVRCWGQRGTLHLYQPQDWPLVCAATGARLRQQSEDRVRRIEAKDGSRSMAALDRAGEVALEILQRPPHRVSKSSLEEVGDAVLAGESYSAFLRLCSEGHASRVEAGDNKEAVLAWRPSLLPELEWREPSFEEAMIEVARRFFHGYGPATEADFRYWLGVPAGESKPAVEALCTLGELIEIAVDGGPLKQDRQLVPAVDAEMLVEQPPPPGRWPVRLLGRFDPLILAHVDKSWWIEPEHYRRVWHHTHIEPTLLVGGRIAGVWRYKRMARGLRISVEMFAGATPGRMVMNAIAGQANRVSTALGAPLLDHVVTSD
jgi:hypothetical protein